MGLFDLLQDRRKLLSACGFILHGCSSFASWGAALSKDCVGVSAVCGVSAVWGAASAGARALARCSAAITPASFLIALSRRNVNCGTALILLQVNASEWNIHRGAGR